MKNPCVAVLSGFTAPETPYFMRGTDQYKQVSNKPFGDGSVRLTLEWESRDRRFVSLTQAKNPWVSRAFGFLGAFLD